MRGRPVGFKVKHCHKCKYYDSKHDSIPCKNCWNIGNNGKDYCVGIDYPEPLPFTKLEVDDNSLLEMRIEHLETMLCELLNRN
jgi:hypothetical protein